MKDILVKQSKTSESKSLRTRGTGCCLRPRKPKYRKGVATLYVLTAAPVFLILLCVVIELGNLWLARTELENSLEAAALAGAKRWHDTNMTSEARDYAVAYGEFNKVVGQTLTLDRNDGGGGANDNFSVNGEIVLGSVEGSPNDYIFDPNTAPSGLSGVRVSLVITIMTQMGGDTFNDVNTGEPSFIINGFCADDGAMPTPNLISNIKLTNVTFNVSTVSPSGVGFFDLRDKTGGGIGSGADQNNGLQPISAVTAGDGITFDIFSDYVPLFMSGVTTTTSSTLQLNFPSNDFDPNVGDEFRFGVDTDQVGDAHGGGPPGAAIDKGGDFGGATVTATFLDTLTNDVGSISGTMLTVDIDTSVLIFDKVEIGGGNFGVLTRRTFSVNPVCKAIFGETIGPFSVSAEAIALFESATGSLKLIRVKEFK